MAVFLIHASWQCFESEVQINLVFLFLVCIEDELVDDLFHDVFLFLRDTLFTLLNYSFGSLGPLISSIFFKFRLKLVPVDMREVLFELSALLVLLWQLNEVVQLQMDFLQKLTVKDGSKDVFD